MESSNDTGKDSVKADSGKDPTVSGSVSPDVSLFGVHIPNAMIITIASMYRYALFVILIIIICE